MWASYSFSTCSSSLRFIHPSRLGRELWNEHLTGRTVSVASRTGYIDIASMVSFWILKLHTSGHRHQTRSAQIVLILSDSVRWMMHDSWIVHGWLLRQLHFENSSGWHCLLLSHGTTHRPRFSGMVHGHPWPSCDLGRNMWSRIFKLRWLLQWKPLTCYSIPSLIYWCCIWKKIASNLPCFSMFFSCSSNGLGRHMFLNSAELTGTQRRKGQPAACSTMVRKVALIRGCRVVPLAIWCR